MFATLKNAWHIADLRKKILYTLMIILLFRLGAAVPVPFLDASALKGMVEGTGNLLGYLNILSGGSFASATIFALSITPYITSSIVIQLLTVAIPALERMAKEGEDGRKKINKITRYVTVALAVLQAFAYYSLLSNTRHPDTGHSALMYTGGFAGIFSMFVIVSAFTGGAMLIVYLGERIDQHGIGNGISMLLFAGIVSRGGSALGHLWFYIQQANEGQVSYYFTVPLIVALFLALIVVIIIMTNAERRIPVQYAKKVVGRKMYGGQSTFIPIKVNMSGVLPIIFSSSLLAIPGTIKAFVSPNGTGFWAKLLGAFNYDTALYAILYFVLILAFNYFYVAIQYNPIEMSNNLRNNSGTIPGIRPGRPTSDFIARIISKITLIGGIFLAVVAVLPIGIGAVTKMNIALGGTSIIIVVGVALDTFRQLESQMMMRHYKGFLE